VLGVDEGRLGFDGIYLGKETTYLPDGAFDPRILGMITLKLLVDAPTVEGVQAWEHKELLFED
jgi:hypothetical protein